jgi:predicted TIM-barrel fold metal-dependent hydrolase
LGNLPHKKIVALKIAPDTWKDGISLNPGTWNKKVEINIERIIEAASKFDLVIQSHTGSGNSDIREFIPFIEKYGKEIKFQFAHMGNRASGHFIFVPKFIEWLKEGYKVYCDTSYCRGFAPSWLVKEMEEQYPKGLDNILFASDNPWGIFESEFWRVEGINCSDKLKNKIFYENASKLYKA